jgi:hypothetical protein
VRLGSAGALMLAQTFRISFVICRSFNISLQAAEGGLLPRSNMGVPLFLEHVWSVALNLSLCYQSSLLDTCQDGGASDASSCCFRALNAFMPLTSP